MKLKKMFLILIGVAMISTLFANFNISNAASNELYLKLTTTVPGKNIGYSINDPSNSGELQVDSHNIFNIVSYTGNDYKTINDYSKTNFYCLKAGVGFYSKNSSSKTATYVPLCDIREKDKMANSTHTYVKEIANGQYYKQILYLIDNLYIKGTSTESDKMALLAKAGIDKYKLPDGEYFQDDDGNYVYVYYVGKHDYSSLVTYGTVDKDGYTTFLTEDDIVMAQQMALWHFTNNGTIFDKYGKGKTWLYYTKNGSTYNVMSGLTGLGQAEAERAEQIAILYNYLVDSANDNASNYNSTTNTLGKPITTTSNSNLTATEIGNRYVAGPIKLDKANDLVNEISLKITDNNGNAVTDYSFVDSTGKALTQKTVSELIGKEFYISVPKTSVNNKVNIKFNVKYTTKSATIYVDTTTNGDQPIITPEVKNESYDLPFVMTVEGKFDLALRKYIVKVDGTELQNTNTRRPNIDTENTLDKGKETASYNHKKDPVLVKTGSKVTYNISVYNEGDKDGYATEITDQLPTGLKSNLKTGDVITSTKGNTYVVTYDETTNKVIFKLDKTKTVKELSSYVTGKLDRDTIEIECTVTESTTTNKKYLTNVAWISEEYNKADDLTITDQKGSDRDSEPATKPDVTADGLLTEEQGYKGNDSNKDDLTDSEYFYKGKQDDDDFEKLVLLPAKFDLALRKYIVKVDGTELQSTRIPNIDTENTLDKGEETASYKHKKDPVQIKTGSKVTYNISVYNEGDKDGYATEITDQLPTGLKSNLKTGDVITSTKGNTYVVTYDETTNKVIFKLDKTKTVKELSSYVTGKLDRDTIEIECTVTESTTTNKKYLTNVAWISEEYNKADDLTITDQKGSDRDSEPATKPDVTADGLLTEEQGYKGNDSNKDDLTDSEYFYKGKQDDDDFEKLVLLPKIFDLKLVKYITAINGDTSKGRTITSVDSSKLKSGEETTAEYTVSKDPLLVRYGNYVTYTFRIYNEGDLDGYASEITEDIPYGLEFVWSNDIVTNTDGTLNFDKAKDLSEEDKKAIEFNSNYYWTFKDSDINKDGKIEFVESTYLSKETETTENGNLLKAFDSINDDGKGSGLSYKEVSIMLKVTAPDTYDKIIRNEAEISKSTYSDGKEEAKDRDSDTKKWVKYEDDEDYDNIKLQYFDLALRKFITDISGKAVTSRIPQVEYKDGKITYKHPKTPLEVVVGDTVTYTIRVYNEGKLNGYATKVTDDIPEYLEYLPDNKTNKEYRWVMIDKDGKETTDVSKAVKVTTDYLSKEQETATGRKNLLKAFDSSAEISDTNPDYRNLKIAFKVKDPKSSDYIITNHAQISDDADEDGNPIDDIDSIPDEWNDGEDDQDVEHVKVQYFDLALRKWVTQAIVIENGKQTVTNTGHKAEDDPEEIVKVDLDRKKLSNVTVKFVYKIRVTNEGDIAGYAKEITDYVPSGLKFVAEDNKGWTDEGNNVISTRLLEKTLLQPGESATVEVTLTWINGTDNMGLKVNTAEISEDYNDKHVPDRDSTPDNKKPGEDDIDDAPVMLSIKLGEYTIDTIYFVLGGVILITLAGGIVLIKKFVL